MEERAWARLGIILPQTLRIALRLEAARRDTTITQIVIESLEEYLRRATPTAA